MSDFSWVTQLGGSSARAFLLQSPGKESGGIPVTWRDDVREDFLRSKDKPVGTAPDGECGDIERPKKFLQVIC